MYGKMKYGKVLLSVTIAVALLISALPAMGINPVYPVPNGDYDMAFNDQWIPTDMPLPDSYELLNETFDADLGVFTAYDLGGDGSYIWTTGWANFDTGAADAEDDGLMTMVNLTALDPACLDEINLEFWHWGTGGVFDCEIDGVGTGPYTAGALVDENIDLTAYAGSVIEINFTTTDATAARDFNIDDVLITYTYLVDIQVDEILGMTDGGYISVFPRYIEFNVTNLGSADATMVDFHLQIYREEPIDPELYHCWDLEECFIITWDTYSADGDQATWYYTEQRSYSPTHSYASKPDYLDTYEANSEDYLYLQDPFEIPTEYMGLDVVSAYLTFWVWAEGEFDGTNAVDFGNVTIYDDTGAIIYGEDGPYYDTGGEWEQVEIDISAAIGDEILIEFGWFADEFINYEGMYVDDICIELGFTSDQPLVHQGYKYADLDALNTTTLQFTLPVDLGEGTYFFQIYTDIEDCDLTNNEINWTIIYEDICDAAITDVSIEMSEYEMPDEGYVEIPINVTVCNTGTLTKDVPVVISAQHLLEDVIIYDDVEGGDPGWGWMFVAGGVADDIWEITEDDFYSPTHSWGVFDEATTVGNAKLWAPLTDVIDIEGGLKWDAEIKYNIPGGSLGAVPAFRASTYYWDLGVYVDPANQRVNPWTGASGWTHFSADEFIQANTLYWEFNNFWGGLGELDTLAELIEGMNNRYGPPGQDVEDFSELEFGFLLESTALASDEGFWFDDFKLYSEYAGASVWDTTYVVEDLAPGDCVEFQVIWNTTEYCDYLVTAEIDLDCDENESNNLGQDTVRIYEQIYTDYDEFECDDNTYGGDDQWQIAEECSVCPENHAWWNGETTNYSADRDDLLIIDETFNFSLDLMGYLNFSTYFLIEDAFDYGYVEISNDSGDTWYIIGEYTNLSGGWTDISIVLMPGVTIMTSPYTGLADFFMPLTYFTEDMHFRFRFYSDGNTNWKGWYIDNVNLTMFNGTAYNTYFFDDMESGDGNWLTMYQYYGCHWHEETVFGAADAPSAEYIWNGEPNIYIGDGVLYERHFYDGDGFWTGWTGSTTGGSSWNYWFGINSERLLVTGAGPLNDWLNTTIDLTTAQAPILVEFGSSFAGYAGPYWFFATDGVTTLNFPITFSYGGGHFINGEWFLFDIGALAGASDVTMGFHANHTSAGGDQFAQWTMFINTSGPMIPAEQYYNNVDEKAVFCFDLMNAYEAILQFEHNYSFAEGDVGWVEILDGSTWQPILYVTGASDWAANELDITSYINHDGETCVRFRFISNDNGTDMGWLVDMVGIEGKIDDVIPTISCALDPAAPNGNCNWYKTAVTFTASAMDNVGIGEILYRIDGGSWKTYTGPITISVDGEHTVEAYALDTVGNPSAMCTETFMIDTTAPTVSITGPQNGYIYLFGRELFANPLGGTIIIGGIDFSATASDSMSGIDYVSFAVDGMSYEKATSPYTIYWEKFDLLPTSYTLTVSAYDVAGNKASDATLSFTHWL
jgi:hypothetical protein